MAKRTTIQVDNKADYRLVGLVSPLPDYRICWLLNKLFDISLYKIDDIQIDDANLKVVNAFSCFTYHEPITKTFFYLYKNKSEGGYFIPEIKQADYVYAIKGNFYKAQVSEIISKIKSILEIQLTFHINTDQIKSGNYLLK